MKMKMAMMMMTPMARMTKMKKKLLRGIKKEKPKAGASSVEFSKAKIFFFNRIF